MQTVSIRFKIDKYQVIFRNVLFDISGINYDDNVIDALTVGYLEGTLLEERSGEEVLHVLLSDFVNTENISYVSNVIIEVNDVLKSLVALYTLKLDEVTRFELQYDFITVFGKTYHDN